MLRTSLVVASHLASGLKATDQAAPSACEMLYALAGCILAISSFISSRFGP
jgi:hypothetical protein